MTDDFGHAVELFPALKDKCAVRLVSRLNGVKEQARIQQENQGFFKEMVGFFTGETRRRQDHMNRHVSEALEENFEQLARIMEAVALNGNTLSLVVDEIKSLQNNSHIFAENIIEITSRLNCIEDLVEKKFDQLDRKIDEIDCRLKARQHIDIAFHRWESGLLNILPVSLRGYSVLEELWWGDFGFYVRKHPGREAERLLFYLVNRMSDSFSDDLGVSQLQRVPRGSWSCNGSVAVTDCSILMKSADFLADWKNVDNVPFVTFLSSLREGERDHLLVPYLFNSSRLGKEIVNEMFVVRSTV